MISKTSDKNDSLNELSLALRHHFRPIPSNLLPS
jgi:hypothetical protein